MSGGEQVKNSATFQRRDTRNLKPFFAHQRQAAGESTASTASTTAGSEQREVGVLGSFGLGLAIASPLILFAILALRSSWHR